MAAGKELRYRILRYLSERQGGRTGLGDITRDLSLTALEVSDQLDILHDLGAIKANRTIDGGAVPTLKGAGKLLLEELEQEFGRAPSSGRVTAEAKSATGYEWDAFIAHASEDKETFVRQLAKALSQDFRIWYDDFTLTVGDNLRRSIDRGLKNSRFGIVVLSKHFFQKEWPQKELDGLVAKERDGTKVILPVWLDVEYEDVANYSLLLADRVAAKAKDGLDRVVADVRDAIGARGPQTKPPSAQRQRGRIKVTEDDDLIESHGVLWEWDTYFSGGKGGMDGPFCPNDCVRLKYQTPASQPSLPRTGLGEEPEPAGLFPPSSPLPPLSRPFSPDLEYIEPGREPTDQDTVGGISGGRLFCIKCREAYLLTPEPFVFRSTVAATTVRDARRDAALLFEAKARRRRAKQLGP